MPSLREQLLATLFCKRIIPFVTEEDEGKALRLATKLLAAWGNRVGRRPGKGYLDVNDVRSELWIDPPKRMFRKTDGSYAFDGRTMAKQLREVRLLPDRRPTRPDGVEEEQDAPLDAKARVAALRAVLSPRERQALELELQGLSRTDAARKMRIGRGTLDAMWARIKTKARGIGEESSSSSPTTP